MEFFVNRYRCSVCVCVCVHTQNKIVLVAKLINASTIISSGSFHFPSYFQHIYKTLKLLIKIHIYMYIYSILFFRIPLVSRDRNTGKMSSGQIWTTGPKEGYQKRELMNYLCSLSLCLSVCLSLFLSAAQLCLSWPTCLLVCFK